MKRNGAGSHNWGVEGEDEDAGEEMPEQAAPAFDADDNDAPEAADEAPEPPPVVEVRPAALKCCACRIGCSQVAATAASCEHG